jgi:hypothetical protein
MEDAYLAQERVDAVAGLQVRKHRRTGDLQEVHDQQNPRVGGERGISRIVASAPFAPVFYRKNKRANPRIQLCVGLDKQRVSQCPRIIQGYVDLQM